MGKTREIARIECNEEVAAGIFCMSVSAPSIAALAKPGQFVQVCVYGVPSVQFLRMPFAVYDADPSSGTVDICYQVVGEGTQQLSELASGGFVDLVGPIGNGWSIPQDAKRALLVCGGVGAPALNMLARALADVGVVVDAVMGAQTASKLACDDRIGASVNKNGGELYITTDDGSKGVHGFVTAVSDELIASGQYDYVAVCGPLPMERNVVRVPLEYKVFCEVSTEKLMACGVGACLGCVIETTKGRMRCCVDGPVFDASEVIW